MWPMVLRSWCSRSDRRKRGRPIFCWLQGARCDLTVICNSPAGGPTSLQILAEHHQIRRLICTYAMLPTTPTPIAEQIRAARSKPRWFHGALVGESARRHRQRRSIPREVSTPSRRAGSVVSGMHYVLETALRADYSLLQAYRVMPPAASRTGGAGAASARRSRRQRRRRSQK
jgi:acyl CoA:acetate/3-ketoacid CoA transferase alpha subunit